MIEETIYRKRKGTPFLYEEAAVMYMEFDRQIKRLESELNFLRHFVQNSSGFVPDNYVQISLDALERNSGDKVQIIADFILTRSLLEQQLGEEDALAILRSSASEGSEIPNAVNYRGVSAIVINKDTVRKRVLARTNTSIPLLLWLNDNEICLTPGGAVKGLVNSQQES